MRALAARSATATGIEARAGSVLERGDVDAWAGLDPYLAQTRQEQGSRLLYRNPEFQTYGVLNVREEFLAKRPEQVRAVRAAYETARTWALAHPAELAALLAKDSAVSLPIAQEQLQRTVLTVDPTPGLAQRAVLARVVPIIVADGTVRSKEAADTALASLIVPAT